MVCPSSLDEPAYTATWENSFNSPLPPATGSYALSAGHLGPNFGVSLDVKYYNSGMFLYKLTRRAQEIVDGLSNTFLASETLQGQNNDHRGHIWWASVAGFVTYLMPNSPEPDTLTGGTCRNAPTENLPCTTTATATRPRLIAARSRHPGGVQTAYCDGSARFIVNNISATIWSALSTSRGGEAVAAAGP